MRLIGTDVSRSPDNLGFIRVSAEVKPDHGGETRLFWFDLPEELQDGVTTAGDPWAVLMLPWACSVGEPVRLGLPVDQLLLDNLHGLQRIWTSWHPGDLAMVAIEAPEGACGGTAPGQGATGAFFSGGIDSLFTLLRHNDRLTGTGSALIDDLIYVAGFNTSRADLSAAERALRPMAESFGKRFVPIRTNIRYSTQQTPTPYNNALQMIHFAHGAALAVIGHILGRRYKEIIISATQDYSRLHPWGSHPLTDPLLGSRGLRITHDGAAFDRVERTRLVATSDTALAALQVCWQDRKDGNCSVCRKCLRTMATLDLLGAKNRAITFDWSGYDMKTLSRVWRNNEAEISFFLEIIEAARRAGRDDIAAAATKSIRFSRRKQRLLNAIDSNPVSRSGWQAFRALRGAVRRPASAAIRTASGAAR